MPASLLEVADWAMLALAIILVLSLIATFPKRPTSL